MHATTEKLSHINKQLPRTLPKKPVPFISKMNKIDLEEPIKIPYILTIIINIMNSVAIEHNCFVVCYQKDLWTNKNFEEKQEFFTTFQEMYHRGGFNAADIYYILDGYAPGITNDVGYMSQMLFVPPTRYLQWLISLIHTRLNCQKKRC